MCEDALLYWFIGGLVYDSIAQETWLELALSTLEITALIISFLLIKTGLVYDYSALYGRFRSENTNAMTDRVFNMVLIRYGYKRGTVDG